MNETYTAQVTVTGMTCAGCSARVEKALAALPDVQKAAVNLATGGAFVVAGRPIDVTELKRAVEQAGYGTTDEPLDQVEAARYRSARWRAALAVVAMIPPMVLMALHMTGHHFHGMGKVMEWVDLVCGALAIFVAGSGTLKGAWIAVSHGHGNMDVLVALGALSSWATSILRLCGLMVPSFGMLASMILGLHLVGRFIESRLRDKAAREIRALLALRVTSARVVTENGEVEMAVELLERGTRVHILAGERVPADCRVEGGSGALDESMLTGEPMPQSKALGDELTGGSVLVTGDLYAVVTRVGEESTLNQIIDVITQAQSGKIPLQAVADRVTGFFVPLVLALALASGLVWLIFGPQLTGFLDWARGVLPWVSTSHDRLTLGLLAFLSTLLIACPCALGLATPMALIAATGKASQFGMLFRNGEALQTLATVDTALFDKTGTLTLGKPEVAWHNLSQEFCQIVAGMERSSSHPLAKALTALAPDAHALEGVVEEAGSGLSLTLEGHHYEVGRPLSAEGLVAEHQALGRTVVELRVDGQVKGHVALEDPLRPEAKDLIAKLKALGVEPHMATGDNRGSAHRVAGQLGISCVEAELKPQDKLALLRRLQGQGKKVLMMGDGINDAAALKGADVGVAVGEGSELAVESADLISLRDGGVHLADTVALARKTRRVIAQNLFWAFCYNLVALPLAMSCLLHPMMAEVGMTLSSISVIANSLRIRRS